MNVAETTAHALLFLNKELGALLEPLGLALVALHLDPATPTHAHPAFEGEHPHALVDLQLLSAITGAEIWRGQPAPILHLAFFARSVTGEFSFPRLACMHWVTSASTVSDDSVDEFFAQDWQELREQLAEVTQLLHEQSLLALAQIAPINRYGMHERAESFRMMCRSLLATGQEKA